MSTRVFHDIEKKIIKSLKETSNQSPDKLCNSTGLSIDQVRRGIEWLRLKELVTVSKSESNVLSLGKNGLDAFHNGLPERRLINLLVDGPQDISSIRQELGDEFGPAMGIARKNKWVTNVDNKLKLINTPDVIPAEYVITKIGTDGILRDTIHATDDTVLDDLLKRPDYIVQSITKQQTISLTDLAISLEIDEPKTVTSSLTTKFGISGFDVTADVKQTFVARTHPLKDTINEIREIFVALGFTEITGNMTQSSFWNFDALFTPQDHPAREMQDTFYIDGMSAGDVATESQIQLVAKSHKDNWKYDWDIDKARKMVLRTHTTCLTIQHLAENKPDTARVFSLGRVFRNEKPSYKHLVEFNQVEGVVTGSDVTLRDLMGIQREFYRRIGLEKIKFWPTFFPYTEPSLQTMVYNEELGKWVELFGMGIFRPEVTKPLGIPNPVLAWGGGIERIAMLKYMIDDVREFYANNLGWLRSVRCL